MRGGRGTGLVLLDFDEYTVLVRLLCDGCGALIGERIISVSECKEAAKKTVLCCHCRGLAQRLYGIKPEEFYN